MKKLIILLFLTTNLFGQNQYDRTYQKGGWFFDHIKLTLTDKYTLGLETHIRRINLLKSWQQAILRPYLKVDLGEKTSGTIGYSFIQNYDYNYYSPKVPFHEHNIWGQISFTQKLKNLQLCHRYRLEQRFIQKIEDLPTPHTINKVEFSERIRYRFSMTKTWLVSPNSEDEILVEFFDEIWLGLNNRSLIDHIFNQNWTYFGLAYRFDQSSKISIGYLYQVLNHSSTSLEKNSIIQLGLESTIDLRKT